MGTRGAYGVRIDGQDKLAYHHLDSYPSYLGTGFAARVKALVAQHGVEGLRAKARAMRPVPDFEPLTPELQAAFRDACARLGSRARIHDGEAYEALRELQGRLAEFLEAGAIPDAGAFPCDGLFCEWAYVLDLDTLTFEVYQGGHTRPGPGPYGRHRSDYGSPVRYGAHLVHAIALDALDPEAVAELDDAAPTVTAAHAA